MELNILKLLAGLTLTFTVIIVLIYIALKKEKRNNYRQKELALSTQKHRRSQYSKSYGIADVRTLKSPL